MIQYGFNKKAAKMFISFSLQGIMRGPLLESDCSSLTLILPIFYVMKMLSAYVCCIYSYALQKTFTLEANINNSDQTAPKGH